MEAGGGGQIQTCEMVKGMTVPKAVEKYIYLSMQSGNVVGGLLLFTGDESAR